MIGCAPTAEHWSSLIGLETTGRSHDVREADHGAVSGNLHRATPLAVLREPWPRTVPCASSHSYYLPNPSRVAITHGGIIHCHRRIVPSRGCTWQTETAPMFAAMPNATDPPHETGTCHCLRLLAACVVPRAAHEPSMPRLSSGPRPRRYPGGIRRSWWQSDWIPMKGTADNDATSRRRLLLANDRTRRSKAVASMAPLLMVGK